MNLLILYLKNTIQTDDTNVCKSSLGDFFYRLSLPRRRRTWRQRLLCATEPGFPSFNPWCTALMTRAYDSKDGRLTLVKSVLVAIPLHWITVLGLNKRCLNRWRRSSNGFSRRARFVVWRWFYNSLFLSMHQSANNFAFWQKNCNHVKLNIFKNVIFRGATNHG
jgi:hypothetical protein